MKEQPLDDEGLTTLMCEVESVVNGLPITKSSDDPSDSEAFTPNHLLLLRSGPKLPPGVFRKEDGYSRRLSFTALHFFRVLRVDRNSSLHRFQNNFTRF